VHQLDKERDTELSSAGHRPLVIKGVVMVPAVVILDFAEPAMTFVLVVNVRISLEPVIRLKNFSPNLSLTDSDIISPAVFFEYITFS
jgi:hypothetical protein